MENISIHVVIYFITSSATAIALTRATQLMLLHIHSRLWQLRCSMRWIYAPLFLCRPSLTKVFPSNEQRKWNLLCWFEVKGPTELPVPVQVCLCSLTTPPGSREMFSKEVRCLKRDNLTTECVGLQLLLTTFHLRIKTMSSIEGLRYQAFAEYSSAFVAYSTANANLR